MREGYKAPVLTGYGLTEAAGAVTMCRPGDDDETIATTVGRPLPGLEVIIVDAAGHGLGPGVSGEIAVRGFTVMSGYYEDPVATAEAFTGDGFLRTGDVGVFDARGSLRITDRLKDMYIAGGLNCYPAEIEQALCAMPGVAAAAVVGVDDARLGQVGKAFIVTAAGAELTEPQVIAWARERMASYKAPREVRFLEALPLNATGKVAKDVLRRQV
jgi:acyl-CoA synthetase (AMP-forming)/AMP-acid ligase II